MTTEIILRKVVQTCAACPSQWDAWDLDGHYWYLRYRHGRGSADRQPSPDTRTWTWKDGDLSFTNEGTELADGWISLEDFCRHAGLHIHPAADVQNYDDDADYE